MSDGFPDTYRPFKAAGGADHPRLFAPALRQHPNAFRHGEPSFRDPEAARRWRQVRLWVWHALLADLAATPQADRLVLRGSVLLRHWFGGLAREPGDLDWVVRPATVGVRDAWSRALFPAVERLATRGTLSRVPDVKVEQVRADDIWTYDRVPGRRLAIYWRHAEAGPGCLQLDFTFGEPLWEEPVRTELDLGYGRPLAFWTATRAQSLAWKLLWLEEDAYPEGKDLYDAVLLAEAVFLPRPLLERAFADRTRRGGGLGPDIPHEWRIDWDGFRQEYPHIEGDAKEWQARLAAALAPSFG